MPCYASREFSLFADSWGFSNATISHQYPQWNRMVERCVGTAKKLWCKSSGKEGTLLAYRSRPTPLKSGFTPNQFTFGRAVRSKFGRPSVSVHYDLFGETQLSERQLRPAKWDIKYRSLS